MLRGGPGGGGLWRKVILGENILSTEALLLVVRRMQGKLWLGEESCFMACLSARLNICKDDKHWLMQPGLS